MSNLTRTDTIFGKRVNVVGNITADLVLESLGNIYVKSRNSARTLEEVIRRVALEDPNVTSSRVIIAEKGVEELDKTNLPDGTLIYDKLSNILYLVLDGELIELINVAPEGTGYVKRSGDTMTGRLSINVPEGPPLAVNSSLLVKNLNANYLQGESARSFTRRHANERITGRWTFQSPTWFESNTKFSQDIIVSGSVGSPDFAGGFGGYGWRMDATTNTLTVDNLVVRKLMQVYELVVNKISATNGSLWITNAGKVVHALHIPIYTLSELSSGKIHASDIYNEDEEDELTDEERKKAFWTGFNTGAKFIVIPKNLTDEDYWKEVTLEERMNSDGGNIIGKNPVTYSSLTRKTMRLVSITNANEVFTISGDTVSTNVDFVVNENELGKGYKWKLLYDKDFKYDVEMPIVTKVDYHIFNVSEMYRKNAYKELEQNKVPVENYMESEAWYNNINQAIINLASSGNEELLDILRSNRFLEARDVITCTLPYYKYYATGEFYYIEFEKDFLPVFKPGDLIRCLKWTYGGIKYYDAIVINVPDRSSCIILLAPGVLDKTTKVTYDGDLNRITTEEETNLDLYKTTMHFVDPKDPIIDEEGNEVSPTDEESEEIEKKNILGLVEKDDSLVQVGSLWDAQRQNAVYITSTDINAPHMNVMSLLNRPDYSVIYYIPVYETKKLYVTSKVATGSNSAIPYTGDYYILNSQVKADYILAKKDGETFFWDLNKGALEGVYISDELYLALTPNSNTILKNGDIPSGIKLELWSTEETGEEEFGEEPNEGCLLLEDGGKLLLETRKEELTVVTTSTVKARLGNLDGIVDSNFEEDKLPYGYGLYGLNVFLVGEFYLNNGRSVAEITKDSIDFAVSAVEGLYGNINYAKRDIQRAHNLLKANVYTKGDLMSAGMSIYNGKIALWANSIVLITRDIELSGAEPTALFENGKIKAKYLSLYELHSKLPIYGENNVFLIARSVPACSVVYEGITYEGTQDIHRLVTYAYKSIMTDETINEQDILRDTLYIRRFKLVGGTNELWAVVDLKGQLPLDSNLLPIVNFAKIQRVYYNAQEISQTANSYLYVNDWDDFYLTPQFMHDINLSEDGSLTDSQEEQLLVINPNDYYDAFEVYLEFLYRMLEEYPSLWSLEYDGSGNLGATSITWDTDGIVTVDGILYSKKGNIGGFEIGQYTLSASKIKDRLTVGQYAFVEKPYIGGTGSHLVGFMYKNGDTLTPHPRLTTGIPNILWGATPEYARGDYLYLGENDAYPILFDSEYGRVMFNSYYSPLGRIQGITLDYPNKIAYQLLFGRSVMSGSYLLFDNGLTGTNRDFVSLSRYGMTWRKNAVDLAPKTILYSVTFIPLLNKAQNRYDCFFIENDPSEGRLDAVIYPFRDVQFYWDNSGTGVLIFTRFDLIIPYYNFYFYGGELDSYMKNLVSNFSMGDWFANELKKGRLTLELTSVLGLLTNGGPNTGATIGPLWDNPVKANIDGFHFGGNISEIGYIPSFSKRENIDIDYKLNGKTTGSYMGGDAYFLSSSTSEAQQAFNNYRNGIVIKTSDDDSENVGGFTLNICYMASDLDYSPNLEMREEDNSYYESLYSSSAINNAYNKYIQILNNSLTYYDKVNTTTLNLTLTLKDTLIAALDALELKGNNLLHILYENNSTNFRHESVTQDTVTLKGFLLKATSGDTFTNTFTSLVLPYGIQDAYNEVQEAINNLRDIYLEYSSVDITIQTPVDDALGLHTEETQNKSIKELVENYERLYLTKYLTSLATLPANNFTDSLWQYLNWYFGSVTTLEAGQESTTTSVKDILNQYVTWILDFTWYLSKVQTMKTFIEWYTAENKAYLEYVVNLKSALETIIGLNTGGNLIATLSWVENKHYLTSSDLNGYAKTSDIPDTSSFLTYSDLSGYVTTTDFNKLKDRVKALEDASSSSGGSGT